jgi:hypothetical protein
VTNQLPDTGGDSDSLLLILSECTHSATQSWGYNGIAPGNGGDGLILYGDHGDSIGVVPVKMNFKTTKPTVSSSNKIIFYIIGSATCLFAIGCVVYIAYIHIFSKKNLAYMEEKKVNFMRNSVTELHAR